MDNNNAEITTLAGGCFWCTEAIFKRLKGIKSVLPGYAGGIVKNPSYDQVCTGKTVFYHNQKQKEIAEKSKKDLEKEGVYKDSIVTEITPFRNFYVAEDYHKNYYENHQDAPYCNIVIDPKVNKLLVKYGNDVKEEYKNSF